MSISTILWVVFVQKVHPKRFPPSTRVNTWPVAAMERPQGGADMLGPALNIVVDEGQVCLPFIKTEGINSLPIFLQDFGKPRYMYNNCIYSIHIRYIYMSVHNMSIFLIFSLDLSWLS